MVHTVRDRTTLQICEVCPFADGGIRQPDIKPKRVNGWARGLGDVVADVLAWCGFKKRKTCGCTKRQRLLNRLLPFRRAKVVTVEPPS
jgi:hypothetical protein